MSKTFDYAFEIPSKTFIIGEYLAINGTASLVLATEPSFYIKAIEDTRYGYHKQSPAGHLMNELKFKNLGFSIFDPHQGRGGFGRSTAEYLSVVMSEHILNGEVTDFSDFCLSHLEDFVGRYQKNCGKDYKPSGADLVAQVCGGLCWYDGMNFTADKLAWPFLGYDIFIFHTGKKLPTHEHLKDLKKTNLRSLIPLLIAARSAFDHKNLKVFCQALNEYYATLGELGLSDQSVKKSIDALKRYPQVLAAKGCGAMGIDTVIVVAEKSDMSFIKEICSDQDFQYISSLSNAHPGASFRRTL